MIGWNRISAAGRKLLCNNNVSMARDAATHRSKKQVDCDAKIQDDAGQ